jgi:hypothetical protein
MNVAPSAFQAPGAKYASIRHTKFGGDNKMIVKICIMIYIYIVVGWANTGGKSESSGSEKSIEWDGVKLQVGSSWSKRLSVPGHTMSISFTRTEQIVSTEQR